MPEILTGLKRLGVRIAMTDFGTGFGPRLSAPVRLYAISSPAASSAPSRTAMARQP